MQTLTVHHTPSEFCRPCSCFDRKGDQTSEQTDKQNRAWNCVVRPFIEKKITSRAHHKGLYSHTGNREGEASLLSGINPLATPTPLSTADYKHTAPSGIVNRLRLRLLVLYAEARRPRLLLLSENKGPSSPVEPFWRSVSSTSYT